MSASLQPSLDFLRSLRANNTREWFQANEAAYKTARGAFEDFLRELIARFDAVDDIGALDVSEAVYRIHRDVRFSADKTPYKTTMSAYIAKGGRKTTGRGYYFQIAPDDSMIAGGMYELMPDELARVRAALAADSAPLRAIIAAPDFVRYFGELGGEKVKTAPKGYSKDHPDLDLLRHKSFLATHPITDDQVTDPDFIDHALAVCKAIKPLAVYLHEIVGERDPEALERR